MRTETARTINLSDYTPADFRIPATDLAFDLKPETTRVTAKLTLERSGAAEAPLVLMGERLKLLRVAIDGRELAPADYMVTEETLTIAGVPDRFVLETEVEINPSDNRTLEGLYMSSGRYCSQCEAEGFRKITYFLDRPDVLSVYTVRIEAPDSFPHLLCNGNRLETGSLGDGRHFARWHDPFPKPCYLFALVAGELDVLDDTFTTMTGRVIDLRIFVDTGMRERSIYAMDALKRSMRWDEEAYGREYDLDLFMIVAVRDFNFGAMENKGLNVFNASLLLADPETATDMDYERIESVIAHEYFHNWSGNRVTCRDWFQLCLKEGLTVYRDQGFSKSQRGEAVSRIKDVKALRARQFPEDSGPLAHPVRPSSYQKIDNFYTATVYEKGAEIVGMLRTIVGPETYRKALDHYFATNDGTAATLEDFLASFTAVAVNDDEAATVARMIDWYTQAGTPHVHIAPAFDVASKTLTLRLTQRTEATPGQAEKKPLPIPVKWTLLDSQGKGLGPFDGSGSILSILREAETEIVLDFSGETALDLNDAPVVSALHGFSAPVILTIDEPEDHAFARFRGDADPFNRWEAAQAVAKRLILSAHNEAATTLFGEALQAALFDDRLDAAFKALMLGLPTESDLAQVQSMHGTPIDPAFVHARRSAFKAALSRQLLPVLRDAYDALPVPAQFSPDPNFAGLRALRNALLDLMLAGNNSGAAATDTVNLAARHFASATNMTDRVGGLIALMHVQGVPYQDALDAFYDRFKAEPLVIDKWFSLQAGCPHPQTLARVERLARHPDFDAKTPNRWRALVQAFAGNQSVFHGPDAGKAAGQGYDFLVSQVLTVDAFNPMTAARLIEPLSRFRFYAEPWQAAMRAALERIAKAPNLSKNTAELAGKSLDG